MRIEFTARNTSIPQALEEHAERRLEKLARLSHRLTGVHVVLSRERGRADVEITANLNGDLVRSEVKGHDERVSFDAALEKLERQIARYKARWDKRRRAARAEEPAEEEEPGTAPEPESAEAPQIVRSKSVSLKPMAPEEAALQMELLGHDFFLFRNADSDLVAVVYKRQDGGYGLLECEA